MKNKKLIVCSTQTREKLMANAFLHMTQYDSDSNIIHSSEESSFGPLSPLTTSVGPKSMAQSTFTEEGRTPPIWVNNFPLNAQPHKQMKTICLYTSFSYLWIVYTLSLQSSTHVDKFYRWMWLYRLELFSGANVL